ncbi:MAG: VCBS repeat-containing protein [Calditrichaeota bacterium]|nr:VCBS repeat-containing protein [Calditrichota bacterium]
MSLPIIICLLCFAAFPGQLMGQSFSSSVLLRDLGGVADVVARDFDGDGDVDVMASSYWPGAAIYGQRVAYDSLRAYEVFISAGSGRNLTTGDFDHDGDWDIAYAAWDDNRVYLLRNTGSQNPLALFATDTVFENGSGPFTALAADINGDNLTDLITCELRNATNQVRVFEQLNGSLVEIWLSSLPDDPLGLAVGDLNNDGINEILIAAGQEGGVYIMRRTDIGGYALTQDIPGYTLTAIEVTDLDQDGQTDIVSCDFQTDRVYRWEESGSGWTTTILPGLVMNPRDVAVADFDGDGQLDVACSAQGEQNSGGGIYWWRQQNGSFISEHVINEPNFYGMDIFDYDLDGDPDIVVSNVTSEQVVLVRNLMGTPTRIIGVVSAERGGAPIEGVTVTVEETGATSVTNAQGRYELGTIAGTFTLMFDHACWQHQSIEGVVTQSEDTTYQDASLRRPEMDLPVSSLNVFLQNELLTTHELQIGNYGDAPLVVETVPLSFEPASPWISVSPSTLEVPPGETSALHVTFSPDTTNDGNFEYRGELTLSTNSCPDTSLHVSILAVVLDVSRHDGPLPRMTRLAAGYPNPFNASVSLPVEIADTEHYSLCAYDVLGRETATLFDGRLTPGSYVFRWNAEQFASGTYYVVLKSVRGDWKTPVTLIK